MNGLKRIFLVVFVVSSLVVLALVLNLDHPTSINPAATRGPSNAPGTPDVITPGSDPASQTSQNSSALIGSVIASATSLVGFVMTTMISWRKEKRDSALADMEYRKLETELEKSKLELEKLKKATSKKKLRK